MWEVVETPDFSEWRESLPKQHQARVLFLQRLLAEQGPSLGRPHVDTVSNSRHANMKEMRPTDTLRGFFAFDSQRRAVLLCGGDKAGKGGERTWYRQKIRKADTLFDRHLAHQRRLERRGRKRSGG